MTELEFLQVTQRADRDKMERLQRIERGEGVSSPEMPAPYVDEADEEPQIGSESSFSEEEVKVEKCENVEYHRKMLRVKTELGI